MNTYNMLVEKLIMCMPGVIILSKLKFQTTTYIYSLLCSLKILPLDTLFQFHAFVYEHGQVNFEILSR